MRSASADALPCSAGNRLPAHVEHGHGTLASEDFLVSVLSLQPAAILLQARTVRRVRALLVKGGLQNTTRGLQHSKAV